MNQTSDLNLVVAVVSGFSVVIIFSLLVVMDKLSSLADKIDKLRQEQYQITENALNELKEQNGSS